MTTETPGKAPASAKEITFTCKFCKKTKPFNEMVTLSGYFPPIVACRDCEKTIR